MQFLWGPRPNELLCTEIVKEFMWRSCCHRVRWRVPLARFGGARPSRELSNDDRLAPTLLRAPARRPGSAGAAFGQRLDIVYKTSRQRGDSACAAVGHRLGSVLRSFRTASGQRVDSIRDPSGQRSDSVKAAPEQRINDVWGAPGQRRHCVCEASEEGPAGAGAAPRHVWAALQQRLDSVWAARGQHPDNIWSAPRQRQNSP